MLKSAWDIWFWNQLSKANLLQQYKDNTYSLLLAIKYDYLLYYGAVIYAVSWICETVIPQKVLTHILELSNICDADAQQ